MAQSTTEFYGKIFGGVLQSCAAISDTKENVEVLSKIKQMYKKYLNTFNINAFDPEMIDFMNSPVVDKLIEFKTKSVYEVSAIGGFIPLLEYIRDSKPKDFAKQNRNSHVLVCLAINNNQKETIFWLLDNMTVDLNLLNRHIPRDIRIYPDSYNLIIELQSRGITIIQDSIRWVEVLDPRALEHFRDRLDDRHYMPRTPLTIEQFKHIANMLPRSKENLRINFINFIENYGIQYWRYMFSGGFDKNNLCRSLIWRFDNVDFVNKIERRRIPIQEFFSNIQLVVICDQSEFCRAKYNHLINRENFSEEKLSELFLEQSFSLLNLIGRIPRICKIAYQIYEPENFLNYIKNFRDITITVSTDHFFGTEELISQFNRLARENNITIVHQ
jgi:hypothetical protein